jgi:hypothetical protein
MIKKSENFKMTIFYNSFLLSWQHGGPMKVQRNKMCKSTDKWYLISLGENLDVHIKNNESLKIDISRMTNAQKDDLIILLSDVKSLNNVYFHLQKESDLTFLTHLSTKISKLNLSGTKGLLTEASKQLISRNIENIEFKITGSSEQGDWKNEEENFKDNWCLHRKLLKNDDDQKQRPLLFLDNPQAKRLIEFKQIVDPRSPSYSHRFELITYFDNYQSETPSCIDTSNTQNQKVNRNAHNNTTNSDKSSYDEDLFIEILI